MEFWKHVAQRLLQLLLRVGAHDERLVHGLAEPLNGIDRTGAQYLHVRFDGEELGQREIALLKAQPASRLAQVAVLNLVLRVARQLDWRRPAFFDPEFSKKRP